MLNTIFAYLKHQFSAQSSHLLHSPFVFDFYNQVLKGEKTKIGEEIEALRKNLMRSEEELALTDFGAGFSGNEQTKIIKTVREIAQSSARKRNTGELLHRLCKHYQPKRLLEFGTNLGISSLYQLSALENSRFISMEGDETLAQKAAHHLWAFHFPLQKGKTEILVGEFSAILSQQLNLSQYQPDYVLIDGNHRYQATVDYFYLLLPHLPENAILVFDDIHWSEGMTKAWEEIAQHPEVSVSIDLFWIGICFIRRNQAKEHFTFRFWEG